MECPKAETWGGEEEEDDSRLLSGVCMHDRV
jgi:hypothetical protein